ncbi:hypothetical protein BKA58DRAFT_418884 [Alternaria rosae]|uniref:uncharacterized protein n=1 Tax=Alternaria rosae TaxID=1187941 RepID=UPI001E8CDEBB|nr:uncharacterized protein BKA58DRAFT_418884 [Alternaria rosae]KAH6875326.1 hypothetical protein BKA58DRAFT_418884 [Alternaria rosae]
MTAVTGSIGVLAVLMVILRLIDRFISAKARLGLDDLLIGLAGLASLFQNVPVIVGCPSGRLEFGRDMWGISPARITSSFSLPVYAQSVAKFECSGSFYLRIATSPKLRMTTYILMGTVTCFGISNTGAIMFQCQPISFFWDGWKGETSGRCTVDIRLFGLIRGAIEIMLEEAILSLPLPMLARLQMSWRNKIQIMSMFGVGFIIFIVNCLRLWALVGFDQSSNPT